MKNVLFVAARIECIVVTTQVLFFFHLRIVRYLQYHVDCV